MISTIFRAAPKAKAPPLAEKIAAEIALPKRALLAEDDPFFVDFVRRVAESEFLVEFVVATTAGSARELLFEGCRFDFAILDYRLVNGSGVDLYRAMHEACPMVEVVFLTAYDEPALRTEVESIGPARVYAKTSVTAEFLRSLFSQLGCRRKRTA